MASENNGNGPEDKKRNKRKGALSPYYKRDNMGGFGNPPVATQFKDRNPGGPGRPKGSTTLESAIKKALGRRVPVTQNGKRTKLPAVEVYAERLLEAILSQTSSPVMLEYGRRILEQYGPKENSPSGVTENEQDYRMPDYSLLSEDEFKVFGGLFVRVVGLPPENEQYGSGRVVGDSASDWTFRVSRRADQHMIIERLDVPMDE